MMNPYTDVVTLDCGLNPDGRDIAEHRKMINGRYNKIGPIMCPGCAT